MFNDFHESTRNVGVFGALLGLFLLAGLTGLGMAVYSGMDNSPGKKISIASKIADQKSTMERGQAKLAAAEAELSSLESLAVIAGQVDDINIELDLEGQQIAKLESLKSDLTDDLAAEEEAFNSYRNRYRIAERKRAVGEVLDLSETKGDDYQECTVIGVSPIHLRVRRSSGPEGIPYKELPAALKDRFQFSQDEADAYQGLLNKATANREKQLEKMDKKEKAEAAIQARKDMSKQAAQNEAEAIAKRREADQHRATSVEAKAQANRYRAEADDSRARGQITSKGALATKADAKASKFSRSAIAADKEATRLEMEAAELRTRLAELQDDE